MLKEYITYAIIILVFVYVIYLNSTKSRDKRKKNVEAKFLDLDIDSQLEIVKEEIEYFSEQNTDVLKSPTNAFTFGRIIYQPKNENEESSTGISTYHIKECIVLSGLSLSIFDIELAKNTKIENINDVDFSFEEIDPYLTYPKTQFFFPFDLKGYQLTIHSEEGSTSITFFNAKNPSAYRIHANKEVVDIAEMNEHAGMFIRNYVMGNYFLYQFSKIITTDVEVKTTFN